jgi:hypothetical protein
VEQDPAVCNAKPLEGASRTGVLSGLLHRVGISVGYSATVAGGSVMVRPALTVGLRVWP